MKSSKLGASFNIFSLSSKTQKFKDQFSIHNKISSSKAIIPLHMSLVQMRRGNKRKVTNSQSRKKTNPILRLHKKNPKLKALEKIKSEINRKLFAKYVNPYMSNINHEITPFSKEKKILYYDYYQIGYILNKTKCDLYSKFKDYKLFYDNQEYFLKFFKKDESRVYLTYLLYVTYARDSSVKSTRAICLNKDIKKVKADYNEYIIKNVFEAKRLIFSRDLNKYIPNISSKIYEQTQQKLSRIAIPKYKLIIKPILTKKINYIYIKDVPNTKIPKLIPNYSNYDKKLYSFIKSFLLKKKFAILLINGRKVPKERNTKYLSKEISRDYNMLNSIKTNSSDDEENITNSNILYLSRYYNNSFIKEKNKRYKNREINDIEYLLGKLTKFKTEEINLDEQFEEIANKNNLESLNTIYENENEIFLSTLKKPFIGNRDDLKLKNEKNKHRVGFASSKTKFKSENDLALLYNMKCFNKKDKNKKNKKFKLFLDLSKDEFNFLNKDNNKQNDNEEKGKNIFKNYFHDRFINPKKYKEYLIKSPFLKTLVNLKDSFTNQKISKSSSKERNISSNSSEKSNINSFKDTYKFLLEINKKERREELVDDLINKANKIYMQLKTMTDMEKKRINFKKSGAFAFTFNRGINFDKRDNEWDVTENYFNLYKNNSFKKPIITQSSFPLMKKY